MRRLPILFVLLLVLAACSSSDGDGLLTEQTVGGSATEGDVLEELRSRCAAGDYQMCDVLFLASDFGSELESFGDSCGGSVAAGGASCGDQFGVSYDLGQLRGTCGDGDMAACDLLYLYSPSGSLDEAFGDECGGLGEGTSRTCVVSWGFAADAG